MHHFNLNNIKVFFFTFYEIIKKTTEIFYFKVSSGFFNSIAILIIAGNVGDSDFKNYIYATIFVTFCNLVAESSQFSAVRSSLFYFGKQNLFNIKRVINYFFISLFILISILFLLTIFGHNFFNEQNLKYIYFVLFLYMLLNFFGAYKTFLIIIHKQQKMLMISVFVAFFNFLSSISAIIYNSVEIYLMIYITLLFLFVIRIIYSEFKNIDIFKFICKSKKQKNNFNKHFISSLFITLNSNFKNNILTILVGEQTIIYDESLFKIFTVSKRIFENFHKSMSNVLDILYIKIINFYKKSKNKIEIAILATLGVRVTISILLFSALFIYFKIFNIGDQRDVLFVLTSVMLTSLCLFFSSVSAIIVSSTKPLSSIFISYFICVIYLISSYISYQINNFNYTILIYFLSAFISITPISLWTLSFVKFYKIKQIYILLNMALLFLVYLNFYYFTK